MTEYNQCQSQLQGIYVEGIEGCHNEFAAYKLLYSCMNLGNNSHIFSSMARNMQSTITVASVQKPERNQGKRFKSRWEPVVEEKPDKEQGAEQGAAVNHGFSKEGMWNPLKEGQEQGVAGNHGFSKEKVWNPLKEGQSKVNLSFSLTPKNL